MDGGEASMVRRWLHPRKAAASNSTPKASAGSPKMMLSNGKSGARGQVSVMCSPVAVRMKPFTANPRA